MNKKQITKEEAKAYFEEHLEFIKAIAEEKLFSELLLVCLERD